jgi:hypothetical protein
LKRTVYVLRVKPIIDCPLGINIIMLKNELIDKFTIITMASTKTIVLKQTLKNF